MADPRMLGNRQQRVADQHERQLARRIRAGSPGRTRTAPGSPCSRRCGRRRPRTGRGCCTSAGSAPAADSAGTSDPTPTTTPGTVSLPETAWIIARSSGELYISARTLRNIGWKIDRPIVASRSAVGTRIARDGGRARAVERVVVAIAEEEAEVVVAGVLARCSRSSAGLVGPSASSQSSSSPSECGCVEDALGPPAEQRADRARA